MYLVRIVIAWISLLFSHTSHAVSALPPIDKICSEVNCRTESTITVVVDQKQYYKGTVPRSPYIHHKKIIIAPGETLNIEAEVENRKFIRLRHVNDVVSPEKTITVSFKQPGNEKRDPGMLMHISNPFDVPYRYRLVIVRAEKPDRIFPTSTCPVRSNMSSYESWPYGIIRAVLFDFEFIEATDKDKMGCKQW